MRGGDYIYIFVEINKLGYKQLVTRSWLLVLKKKSTCSQLLVTGKSSY